MDALAVGIALVLLIPVIAPRLGWDTLAARGMLAFSVILFGFALVSRALILTEREEGFVVGDAVLTALGVLFLFLAVLRMTPAQRTDREGSVTVARLGRKGKKARHAALEDMTRDDEEAEDEPE